MLKAQTTAINEMHLPEDNPRKCFLMTHKERFAGQRWFDGVFQERRPPHAAVPLLLPAGAAEAGTDPIRTDGVAFRWKGI